MRKVPSFQERHVSYILHPEKLLTDFSANNNNSLNFENFKCLMTDLLKDSQGKSYDLSTLALDELFHICDRNKDGFLDSTEFCDLYKDLLVPLITPVTALLVIDVQNDFIDGALAMKNCPAKQNGTEIIPIINNLLDKHKFDVVAYTFDFHPRDHISFFENANLYKLSEKNKPVKEISVYDTVIFEGPPEMPQKLWPTHCVQHSWGSELHKDLHVCEHSLSIFKGTNSTVDSYSAFFDNMKMSKSDLDAELKKRKVTHVFICGLAFDYCVSFTAIDAAELGYATVVVQDATRGTDDSNIREMEKRLKSANCVLAKSNEIENLIKGNYTKVEFASTLQKRLKDL